jgi:hypothetical protein
MVDFFKETREFVSGVASDAVNFPKTKTGWPAYKQAIVEFYNDTRDELFSFRKAKLYPAASETGAQLENLLKQDTTTEKTESLLALKQQAVDTLGPVAENQWEKGARAGLWTMGAVALTAVASFAIAPTLAVIVPVLAVAAGGAVTVAKFFTNGFRAAGAVEKFSAKIDSEVIGMASGENRAAVFAAPAFQQALVEKGVLKNVFDLGAKRSPKKEANYAALVAKLPKPEPKPAPAPAAPSA